MARRPRSRLIHPRQRRALQACDLRVPRLSRRDVLRAGVGAAGAWALSGCGSSSSAWGAPLNAREGEALLPEAFRPDGTLELYLYGGYAAWDTFYAVPELCDPAAGGEYAGQQWWVFQEGPENVSEVFNRCGYGGGDLLTPFGRDSLGRQVFLGPWVAPLRERQDIVDRMRVFVVRHNQVPHQGGNPMSLTGQRFGSPRMAGTAAHIQRFFGDRDTTGRTVPWAYTLFPRNRDMAANNGTAAAAIGLHRASARPLSIWLSEESQVAAQLSRRRTEGWNQELDALVAHYRQGYAGRLSTGGRQVRSDALADFEYARRAISESGALRDLLTRERLDLLQGESCGEFSEADVSGTGIRLASWLLTDPAAPARYVIAMDGGVLPATGGAGYDTHQYHTTEGARNTLHAMRELVAQINEPGEGDPRKLDLDRHTILITAEFGRTPYAENIDGGLDHWPLGYVQVAIGGWVDNDRSGVVGAIGEDGISVDYVTPSELRAALLLSHGIWPFTPESFAVGNVREGDTELDAAMWLRESVLGYRA